MSFTFSTTIGFFSLCYVNRLSYTLRRSYPIFLSNIYECFIFVLFTNQIFNIIWCWIKVWRIFEKIKSSPNEHTHFLTYWRSNTSFYFVISWAFVYWSASFYTCFQRTIVIFPRILTTVPVLQFTTWVIKIYSIICIICIIRTNCISFWWIPVFRIYASSQFFSIRKVFLL